MECVQETATHVTEYIGGRCTEDGVKGGIGIPGLDSWLVGFSTDTKVIGLEHRAARRAAAGEHDAPLGLRHHGRASARCCSCLGLWLGVSWLRKRDMPKTPWFLRAVAVSGVAAIVALECGWIVTEVGRQPWIVYEVMRTEDAVTDASGVWVSLAVGARALHRRSGSRRCSCCAR